MTSKAARRHRKNEPSSGLPTGPASNRGLTSFTTPCQLWGLAKRVEHRDRGADAADTYKLLRMSDEAEDIFNRPDDAKEQPIQFSLAIVEHQEQQSVKQWKHAFPLRNKMGPKAISSQDAFGLGPVPFSNPTANNGSILTGTIERAKRRSKDGSNKRVEELRNDHYADLCPLIQPPGLDRAYLMQRLAQRGVIKEATKDIASTLECYLIK